MTARSARKQEMAEARPTLKTVILKPHRMQDFIVYRIQVDDRKQVLRRMELSSKTDFALRSRSIDVG